MVYICLLKQSLPLAWGPSHGLHTHCGQTYEKGFVSVIIYQVPDALGQKNLLPSRVAIWRSRKREPSEHLSLSLQDSCQ